MLVDPNKKWVTIFHHTVRHMFFVFYPIFLFLAFYMSLLGGATAINWGKFEDIVKSYKNLYVWYYNYWSYLAVEDQLLKKFRVLDHVFGSILFLYLVIKYILSYSVYTLVVVRDFIKSLTTKVYIYIISMRFGIGDFFLSIFSILFIIRYYFIGFFIFIFNLVLLAVADFLGIFYLLFVEEVYYNYLVAVAFYVFSDTRHVGGSRFLAIINFLKILRKGLSIGPYGVHFYRFFEQSLFARIFKSLKRGPYAWLAEEGKLTKYRAMHFSKVLLLRLLMIFYFFLPGGDDYRRRSVLWQLVISDLPEDRYVDTSLTPGLRYQAPNYFFVYSNIFAIDILEYTEVLFTSQQEVLIKLLWSRKQYFNKLKDKYLRLIEIVFNYFYKFGMFFMSVLWALFKLFYLLVYFCRSSFVIVINIAIILCLQLLNFIAHIIRFFLVVQINSVLYLYRMSQISSKFLMHLYDWLFGIIFFVIFFVLVIAPLHYYLIQTLWGMGGMFLAYFYVLWLPLLFLSGIYDEWKVVLHELGEWLFVVCFHMGGWSIVYLRVEIYSRFWFLEPEYEQNFWGPMGQEYQGFYFVYAGWAMDALHVIFY